MKARALLLLVFALPSLPALVVEPLARTVSVIDGDTIEIHGTRIRLHGIDAPESRQECTRPDGTSWRCGQHAALALSDHIGRAVVRCQPRDRDRCGRIVAICFEGDEDLNRWMVANGWAVAFRRYSPDYVGDEDNAHQARLGLWAGTFEMPWDWRARKTRH
jgi:endonuclease YncB( thermonuclease family)